ncbi:MAG: preprotein translocase subunit YajC [Candidatus Cloacimonas sp.]|jgi:preprotein translocase subunit YajC|nr:preprotein translocase subunit YajC [Candidatus Cloacimonadota bacterium]
MYYVLLQTATEGQQPNPLISFLPFLFIIVIMYFLIIRPQQKKQKEQQKMLDDLQENDTVVTTGGIIGKIVKIRKERDSVILKVDDNAKLEVKRIAIAGVISEPEKK